MSDQDPTLMDERERREANKFIVNHLQRTMLDGRGELAGLRRKLGVTYWVIVLLSIVMFFVGIVLISVPAIAAFRGEIEELQSLIAAGFGIADLAALFLFRPLDRVHKIMGDMSQLVLALNSFQTQAGLRLLQMDGLNRDSMGQAAVDINAAAKDSIKLIQDYFEAATTVK